MLHPVWEDGSCQHLYRMRFEGVLERVAFKRIHLVIGQGKAAFSKNNAFAVADEFNQARHAVLPVAFNRGHVVIGWHRAVV